MLIWFLRTLSKAAKTFRLIPIKSSLLHHSEHLNLIFFETLGLGRHLIYGHQGKFHKRLSKSIWKTGNKNYLDYYLVYFFICNLTRNLDEIKMMFLVKQYLPSEVFSHSFCSQSGWSTDFWALRLIYLNEKDLGEYPGSEPLSSGERIILLWILWFRVLGEVLQNN